MDQDNGSLYGTPFPEYIEDSQLVRTALMRGYIDHVAYSLLGVILHKKGALGDEEVKRLIQRRIGDTIGVNGDIDKAIRELSSNPIPPQHISLFEAWESEAEAITGFTRSTRGMTDSSTPSSASGLSLVHRAGMLRITNNVDTLKDEHWRPLLRLPRS